MSDKALVTNSYLTDIANAIRSKKGTQDTFLPSEMAGAISSISSKQFFDFDYSYNPSYAVELSKINFVQSGVLLNNSVSYINIRTVDTAYFTLPFTIEVDVVSVDYTQSSTHCRFITADSTKGLIYRSGSVWALYGSEWVESGEHDAHFFDNSTVKIVVDENNYWHIYKNGILWWEPEITLSLPTSGISVGSSSGSTFRELTINRIKIH